ncbi:MAG: dihydrodipicolinate synthase family protein [Deltaproteobacteria bacterium]|nr:dihydrodipicolinate synthase family protein [Deltaproteobacteria bacterium]
MNAQQRIRGVLSTVVTPFNADYTPDAGRFVRHCRWLVSQNVGLACFGNTSEANSLSVDERIALLDALLEDGIDPGRMMPGTGLCSLSDSVRLTDHAVRTGCAGVLMLPPFYYKGVSDEGLFRYYSEVVQRVGEARLRIYLYHIPPVAQVGITLTLIERLRKAYPQNVAGIKDSSGDWRHTQTILDRFAEEGFDVFPASETFLLAALRNGGAGCISAIANLNPAAMHQLYCHWQAGNADDQQDALNRLRNTVSRQALIPAIKAALAHYLGERSWATVRPPLVELTAEQRAKLLSDLAGVDFTMPDLPRSSG